MIKRFETKLLEETFQFIEKQSLKARKKIFQNIRRAEQQSDPKFFKKLTANPFSASVLVILSI